MPEPSGFSPSVDRFFEGKISVREFLVDFFGALMPGVFFLLFLICCFFLPLVIGLRSLLCLVTRPDASFHLLAPVTGFDFGQGSFVFQIVLFLLFLSFGYIIGTLFYRRDPKTPDYKSFLKIAKKFKDAGEVSNWVVRVREDGTNHPYISDPKRFKKCKVMQTDVQFPYNNLKGYLSARGLDELASKIPWDLSQNEQDINKRSKTFINSLKIRLQFHFPEQSSTIIKNEAHIRLSSSMWYATKSLFAFSTAGFIIMLAMALLLYVFMNALFMTNLEILFIGLISPLASGFVALQYKSGIEHYFHYQRVREIFYVLETAVSASKRLENGAQLIFGAESGV